MLKQARIAIFLGLAGTIAAGLPLPVASQASAAEIVSSVDVASLPKKKLTPINRYLSPKDAYSALQKDPKILFIDVRDPIEVSFVGHATEIDANIPLATATYRFNHKSGAYTMQPNKKFLSQVQEALFKAGGDKTTPVFLICRSGARSAVASRLLIKDGYVNVWNLVEGFEGDKDKATKQRTVNGWRNAGLPWGYKIPAEKAWKPVQ